MDKQIIEKILEGAEVAPGMDILDISAGELTGAYAASVQNFRRQLPRRRIRR